MHNNCLFDHNDDSVINLFPPIMKGAAKCCARCLFGIFKRISNYSFILLFSSFFVFANPSDNLILDKNLSSTNSSPVISILNEMKKAVITSDYEIFFVTQDAIDFPMSFQYTHVGSGGDNQANLLYLEGASKEIILHDNTVSYFQTDRIPFSILANHIIEVFPDFIYNDFNVLLENYDFVLLGKARTANRASQLIRVIPKDKDRYNYVIWIDEDTSLPLRIDLLDLDSKVIHQTKVLSVNLSFDKTLFNDSINSRDYPILLSVDNEDENLDQWAPSWVPKGFKKIAAYNIDFENENIDTQLFSDGIFSFAINVSKLTNNKSTHISKQGARTVYSINVGGMNVVIVGELPVETIAKIASNIKSKSK